MLVRRDSLNGVVRVDRLQDAGGNAGKWTTLVASVTGRFGLPRPSWFDGSIVFDESLGEIAHNKHEFHCDTTTATGAVRPGDSVVVLSDTPMKGKRMVIAGVRGREYGADGHLEWLVIETMEKVTV